MFKLLQNLKGDPRYNDVGKRTLNGEEVEVAFKNWGIGIKPEDGYLQL